MSEDASEYSVIVPPLFEGDGPMTITVAKFGGGTPGKAYTGTWNVFLYDGEVILDATILTTGMPKRHDEAAALAALGFADGIDEFDDMGLYDRLTVWAKVIVKAGSYRPGSQIGNGNTQVNHFG
jgi:hypothetical protein